MELIAFGDGNFTIFFLVAELLKEEMGAYY